MTEKEYEEKMKLAKSEYENNTREIAKEFAFSNKRASIGDIVSDGCWIIKVDEIKFSRGFNCKPYCVYYGQRLTKKGEIRKDKERCCVSEHSIENITKVSINEN